MRKQGLVMAGAGFLFMCAGSLEAAVAPCALVPGATVNSPNDVLFQYADWTAAGFTCEQGDKIYSFFNPGYAPTDTTVRFILQNLGGAEVNTVVFGGSFTRDFKITYSILVDTGISSGTIYKVSGDMQNPALSGTPSSARTVFNAASKFSATSWSTMASPGTPILIPSLTSLQVTDLYIANGGAVTNIGDSFFQVAAIVRQDTGGGILKP